VSDLSGTRASEYYKAYIKSIKWVAKATAWKRETGKCEKCGATELLTVHHLHYRTLGCEKRSDVQVLCKECHFKTHEEEAESSAYWRGYATWCHKRGLDQELDYTEQFAEWVMRRSYR
jgi:RNase P subunit RPR2